MTTVEIPVEETTVVALADERRREAIGHSINRLLRPGADDPLLPLLDRTAAEAGNAGLIESEVEAELAAYNAERRT